MSFKKNWVFFYLTAICLALCTIILTQSAYAQMPDLQNKATKAGVITLHKETIPHTVVLSGQSLAEENATIRPLVDGVITDILYEAGRPITKGTPLFQIEKESYLADLDVAKAALESAKAAVPSAEENYERYKKLAGTGVSQSEVDVARTELQQAKAAVRAAKADLKTTQINLDRTTIKSPIDGVVATANVSIGDLVTAGQSDELTTVTKLNPISVDLAETSSRLLKIRHKIASGEMKPGSKIDAVLILENGEKYKEKGTVENISSNVSSSTGTLTVRVQFKNEERLILPGVFLRARLTMGTTEGYLVPQLAAEPQADSTILVWVLGDDNTAQETYLETQGTTDTAWIVNSGLDEGTYLLVDNLDDLTQGAAITPIDVTIDDDGVVRDVTNVTTQE